MDVRIASSKLREKLKEDESLVEMFDDILLAFTTRYDQLLDY